MALTEITAPDDYHPIWHPVIFEFDSDIKTNDEFKYVYNLIATGFGGTRVIKVRPRPGDGFGFLDVRRHIQDLYDVIEFDIKETDYQTGPFSQYNLRVDEEFKDGAGDIITVVGSIVTFFGFNFILSRNDILIYTEDDYRLLTSADKLLWNIEENVKVLKDDIFFVHHLQNNLSGTVVSHITEFFDDGSTNVITASKVFTNRANLITLDLLAILTDPDNTFKIEFKFRNAPNTSDISETVTLQLVDSCSVFKNNRIIYLDSQGSYNSLNFDFVSNTDTTVTPKTFRKFINASTAVDISRELTRYFIDAEDVHTVNSDILTDKHEVMIRDLIKSTDVFLDVRTDADFPDVDFLSIEILTRSHKTQKSENSELLQKTIRYRFSFDEVTR